jgi:nitrite reductase/ring-hydroxylating ferredoxin subunit
MLEKYNEPDDKYPKKPAVICPWHGWAFFIETGGLKLFLCA